MKVGIRLGISFGVVLLLMLAIVVVGLNNMAKMNQSTEQIVKDRHVKAVLVNDAIARTFDNGRSTRNLLLLDDAQGIEKNKQTIQANREKIKAALDQLDKNDQQPPKGRELMTTILRQRDALDPKYEELIPLARSDRKRATEFQMTSFAPTNTAYARAMRDMADFQGGMMEQDGTAAAEAYASARDLMMGLGIAAALAGMALAWAMTRKLMTQLGGEPDAAADLRARIDLKAGDSSSLMAAMNGMRDTLQGLITQISRKILSHP